MISALLNRAKDVIVRLVPAARHRGTSEGSERLQLYDALVYGERLTLSPPPPRADFPPTLRELPLAGVERLTIRPASYDEYLAQFIEGEKGLPMMRSRLVEALSPGLRNLLTDPPFDVRIWWSSAAPELDDLPWELAADFSPPHRSTRVVLLRGIPPETPLPVIPIAGDPRLALVGTQAGWPRWARELVDQLGPSVVPFDMPIRAGVAGAVEQGIEMLHLFSDGTISPALEGILYDHDPRRRYAEIAPSELSRMLMGSRVAVLSLSPSPIPYSEADFIPLAGRNVLSAYRAFAYLGSCTLPLPSILAALGPVPEPMIGQFWKAFYEALIASWHLTGSLHTAQRLFPFPLPIALFCHHAGGKLFQHADAPPKVTEGPNAVRQDLLQSEALTSGLATLLDKYGELPPTVRALVESETRRQDELRGELGSWINTSEEL